MTNAYPELPCLKYEQTNVPMTAVVSYLHSLACPIEVKRMSYIMFRNESGNGEHGVNNNYCGIQADGARWSDQFTPMFSGTVLCPENGTGRTRVFLAFHRWEDCVAMLVNRVKGRGLYIGAPGIKTENDLAHCYYKQWVGNPPTPQGLKDFESMYGQAMALFRVANQEIATHITADLSADELNKQELEKSA